MIENLQEIVKLLQPQDGEISEVKIVLTFSKEDLARAYPKGEVHFEVQARQIRPHKYAIGNVTSSFDLQEYVKVFRNTLRETRRRILQL